MVKVITLTPSLDRVFEDITRQAKIAIASGSMEIAKVYRRELRRSLTQSNPKGNGQYSGNLWDSLEPHKVGKKWVISIPQYGVLYDRARPRSVALEEGRAITDWARAHGFKGHSGGKGKVRRLWVKPHPWIDKGLNRANRYITKTMNRSLNKYMKGGK